MKNFTKALIAATLGVLPLSAPADAYTYTFLNTLDKPVAIDFCGIAMVGCTMFTGEYDIEETNRHVTRFESGNLIRYTGAQWLSGPQTIYPGKMVSYDFRGATIGICINLDSVKLAIDGGSFFPLQPYHVDSTYMSSLIMKMANLGSGVEKLGKAVAKIDKPEVKVAGKVVGALGGLLEPITSLYAVSACKDGTFVIGIDKTGQIVMQTADF